MFSSLKSLFNRSRAGRKGSARTVQPKKRSRRAFLSVEALEDRRVPTVLLVNSPLDLLNTPNTLRAAINQANVDGAQGIGDDIFFAGDQMQGAHILLQLGPLELTAGARVSVWNRDFYQNFPKNVVLNGDGGSIFQVDSGASLGLHEQTLAGGTANAFVGPNGGAINNAGALTLSLCNFINNSATGMGGAIYNTGTLGVRYPSTFTGNTAQLGGAIYNVAGSTASLIGTFANNSASGNGGAFYNDGVMTVAASTLSGNTAQNNAGAIYNHGAMNVATSTLSGNTAQNDGGAIVNEFQGTMTVSTSTLANNTAQNNAGAISNLGGLTLSAATIVGNTAVYGAGGIANLNALALVDTIVAGNTLTGSSGAGPDVGGSVDTSSAYNLIGDGTGLSGIGNGVNNNQIGSSSAPINPLLFPLGNHGGPTQIMPPQPGSPAVGAGGPVTTLTAAIGTQETVIPVAHPAAIASTASYDGTIQIDGEMMWVTNVDLLNNTLTVIRASLPRSPTSHNAGAGVYFENDQSFTPIVPRAVAIGAAQTTTGPTVSFTVTGPTAAGEMSGVGFTVTITAKDVNGTTTPQYNGPVTLSCSDGTLTWINVTLTNGIGPATVVYLDKAATADTLMATDGSFNGTSVAFPVYPGALAHLHITAPPTATAGVGFNATITGTDWFGNPASGHVTLTSSDGEPVSAVDLFDLSNGQAVDPITLDIAGTDTLSASAPGAVTVSTSLTVIPGPADGFAVTGTSTVTAGDSVTVTVSPVDIHGNITSLGGYVGTTLSCSDTQVIPAAGVAVTFGTNNIATLQFQLVKAEPVTFTANAFLPEPPPFTNTITGTSNTINVIPGGAQKFIVSAAPKPREATPFRVSITPEDFYNNVTSYYGQFTLTSSDGQQVVGGAGINGQGFGPTNVAVTLNDPGAVTLSASAIGQLIIGNSPSITVDAFTANQPNWSGYVLAPGSQVNAVGGNWVQPAASGSGYAAIWVGIDGFGNNTVEQIGTQVQMVDGSPQYSVWYEMVPQNPSEVPITTTSSGSPFQLQAGDQIGAEVRYVSGDGSTSIFVLQITDTPPAASGRPVEVFLTQQTIVNAQQLSAEWVVETPQIGTASDGTPIYSTLANFGQTTFTGAWATVGSTTGAINSFTNVTAMNMNTSLAQDYTSNPPVSSNTLGYNEPPSGVSSSSFTVTYGAAPPSGGAAGEASGSGASTASAYLAAAPSAIPGNGSVVAALPAPQGAAPTQTPAGMQPLAAGLPAVNGRTALDAVFASSAFADHDRWTGHHSRHGSNEITDAVFAQDDPALWFAPASNQ